VDISIKGLIPSDSNTARINVLSQDLAPFLVRGICAISPKRAIDVFFMQMGIVAGCATQMSTPIINGLPGDVTKAQPLFDQRLKKIYPIRLQSANFI
jgi:hypothetical protein